MDQEHEPLGVRPSLPKRTTRCETFPLHEWHKVEKEDIASKVLLKIEHGKELKKGMIGESIEPSATLNT